MSDHNILILMVGVAGLLVSVVLLNIKYKAFLVSTLPIKFDVVSNDGDVATLKDATGEQTFYRRDQLAAPMSQDAFKLLLRTGNRVDDPARFGK